MKALWLSTWRLVTLASFPFISILLLTKSISLDVPNSGPNTWNLGLVSYLCTYFVSLCFRPLIPQQRQQQRSHFGPTYIYTVYFGLFRNRNLSLTNLVVCVCTQWMMNEYLQFLLDFIDNNRTDCLYTVVCCYCCCWWNWYWGWRYCCCCFCPFKNTSNHIRWYEMGYETFWYCTNMLLYFVQ